MTETMNVADEDLVKLLVAIRDASLSVAEAVNAYLKAKAPLEVKAEKVLELFPKDLQGDFELEEAADAWMVKPKRYLGAENFAKIAAIVRQHKGEYVSQGKASHFKLPKAAAK